jgi:hypothetical protein
LRIVFRLTVNRPHLFFPLMCLKEVERLGLTFSFSLPVLFGKPRELNPARLVRP